MLSLRWVFFFAFFGLIQWYAFQAVKTIGFNKWMLSIYSLTIAIIFGNFIYQSLFYTRATGFTPNFSVAMGMFLALFIFQFILILFLAFEDLIRLPQGIYRYFIEKGEENYLPSRRKFISQLAFVLAAIPFASLLVGMVRGKYNYKVLHYALEFDDLPEAFEGFTLTQISDIHSGSFDNAEKVQYGVDLINEQQSDVILFTGDMVNNKAEELIPWKETFAQLRAPMGKFSILGNHDYGDYTEWSSKEEKEDNLKTLIKTQEEMGFSVLLNETYFLEKDGQRLALVGVENWGKGGFKKAGNLDKAVQQVTTDDFKILLSHDPSHWEEKVLPHAYPFQLTLSGHTHGMQFGIEIPGWFKWSPVEWRYKQWAGLYTEQQQWINVNRGFGFLGYPGRVGIWPEITKITLKRSIKEV
ncbi:MAG: metallophosphoesterase [Flavobacteriaceae bacterium]|nr:metallophosphoesterase [Flavobacteriaceae bacterium]